MRLIFFVPHAKAVTAEMLAEHGLDDILRSRNAREVANGPNGEPGLLIADVSFPVDRLVCDAKLQKWSKRFGCSSYVGHYLDDVPTLEDFARDDQVDGVGVQLLDCAEWLVPVLREWREDATFTPRLPRVMYQCVETGAWLLGKVTPTHKELWETSLEIGEDLMKQLRGGSAAEMDYAKLFTFAVMLLAKNYRIDASIVSHLGLLTPALACEIVRAALDWGTLRDHLKNALSRLTMSDGTDSESGQTQPTAD